MAVPRLPHAPAIGDRPHTLAETPLGGMHFTALGGPRRSLRRFPTRTPKITGPDGSMGNANPAGRSEALSRAQLKGFLRGKRAADGGREMATRAAAGALARDPALAFYRVPPTPKELVEYPWRFEEAYRKV